MAWTKEQEKAIYNRGTSIIVSAGAGSGKTAVLSERILEFCLQGNDIRRVLVLTFTNAAAREMKERIRNKLLTHELYEQADFIDSAYITTFDAYSLALVKKYFYKLGISKELTIMDASLMAVKRKDIIEGLFREYYENENPAFYSYLKKYSRQDDREVADIVERLCSKFELLIDFAEFKRNYEDLYFSKDRLNQVLEEYDRYTKEMVSELISALRELLQVCSLDEGSDKLYSSVLGLIDDLEGLSTYEEYYRYLKEYSLPRVSPKADESVKAQKEVCGKILKNLKENVFSKYAFKADMLAELTSVKDDVLFLLEVCHEVMSRLLEYKKRVMMFDYTDIAKYAVELVTKHSDVQAELMNSYDEILVDEYQDTSDIQEAFLKAIENHNLYMVGDIKQSIYRFRNANPYIFKAKYDAYSGHHGGEKIDLTYNFRSRSEVLNDINALFNQLMTDSVGDASYALEHQMKYGQHLYDSSLGDYRLEVLRYPEVPESFTQEETEAFIAAGKIKSIMASSPKVLKGNRYEEVSYNDFAILIDKARSFVTFKRIFEYLNIPLSIEADLDLKDSILPKLFSNIILLIYKTKTHEFDIPYRHALASVARSFLYEYSDEEIYRLLVLHEDYPILEDFKVLSELSEPSYPGLFYQICFRLGVYEKLSYIGDVDNSAVVLEYIYRLLEMLQATAMLLSEVSGYLAEVFEGDIKLSYKLASSSPNSVRIMTIHKSKGLEFPYCIFPLLSSSFNRQDVRASIGFHPAYGIYIPYADEGKSNTIMKTLIANQMTKEDISERVRLLYVAMTRAREKMIMILRDKEYPNSNPKSFSSFQQMLQHYEVFKENIQDISLEAYGITADYKRKKQNTEMPLSQEVPVYYELALPKKADKVRISKELSALPDKHTKANIRLGLELHAALEAMDFTNPQPELLPVSDFVKNTIKAILSHPLFQRISEAETYHEHEFYYTKNQEQYHGIIDLLAVYEDSVDIIDYKLYRLDREEYTRQLKIYRDYVALKWNKKINVYLISLLKAEVKRLEIE